MKTAQFVNFTDESFIGSWDGKLRKYPAGSSEFMPDYLAKHFAKHLVNRELLRTDGSGNLIYKGGDKMTSPKKPEEVPLFTELFNKAYIPDDIDELGDTHDDLGALIGAANKNRADKLAKVDSAKIENVPSPSTSRPSTSQGDEPLQDPTKPQIVLPPDWNNDDDDESSFTGKPIENVAAS